MNNVPYDKQNLLCVDYTSNIGVYILIVRRHVLSQISRHKECLICEHFLFKKRAHTEYILHPRRSNSFSKTQIASRSSLVAHSLHCSLML